MRFERNSSTRIPAITVVTKFHPWACTTWIWLPPFLPPTPPIKRIRNGAAEWGPWCWSPPTCWGRPVCKSHYYSVPGRPTRLQAVTADQPGRAAPWAAGRHSWSAARCARCSYSFQAFKLNAKVQTCFTFSLQHFYRQVPSCHVYFTLFKVHQIKSDARRTVQKNMKWFYFVQWLTMLPMWGSISWG